MTSADCAPPGMVTGLSATMMLWAAGMFIDFAAAVLSPSSGAVLFAMLRDMTKIAIARMMRRKVTTMTIVDRASTNPGQWFSSCSCAFAKVRRPHTPAYAVGYLFVG